MTTSIPADTRKTLPPKSDPPVSERQPEPYNPRPGWRPADDEVTLEAADWRARTGIRRADRALEILAELKPSFEAVRGELETSNTAWAARWKTLSRLGWAVGVPLLVAGLAWSLARFFAWVSTLHH